MAITATPEDNGKTLVIAIEARFDFTSHQDFRAAYESAGAAVRHFIIDLAATEYLDSSALGLLIMLHEHSGGKSGSIEIINASAEIRRILTIASFHRLFNIR